MAFPPEIKCFQTGMGMVPYLHGIGVERVEYLVPYLHGIGVERVEYFTSIIVGMLIYTYTQAKV